jgi:hypothetical protein
MLCNFQSSNIFLLEMKKIRFASFSKLSNFLNILYWFIKTRRMLRYASRFHGKKFRKKNQKIFREFFFQFFWRFIFCSQFEVCLQMFWGSRPAGLAVKEIRTNSSKRLSQIIIRNCWTEMLARSLGHIIILVHFRSKR